MLFKKFESLKLERNSSRQRQVRNMVMKTKTF